MLKKLLWFLFNKHYVGQIIRRTRDLGFNKIDQLDLEIIKIYKNTLKVKFLVTGTTTIVIK